MITNKTMQIREKAVIEIVRLLRAGKLKEELPKLVKKILPGPNPTFRESVYVEREVLTQRLKVYLGLDYKKSKDLELYEVAAMLDEIFAGKCSYLAPDNIVQIVKEGCDACPTNSYYITDLCRCCLEKSCIAVCPKNAVAIVGNRAVINNEMCVKCGLCQKACKFSAVVRLARPCMKACPVGAIFEDECKSSEIDQEKCIQCGQCLLACPFGAIEYIADLPKVVKDMMEGEEMVAIVAPAILGQFGVANNFTTIKEALLKLGFTDVVEAANGADLVAEEEAKHFIDNDTFMTTSCCPSFVAYVNKYQAEYGNNISKVVSPMVKMGEIMKNKYERAKLVFIGPCIAKKMEARKSMVIDYALTFEGLKILFDFADINLTEHQKEEDLEATIDGWNFACSGGVANYVQKIHHLQLKAITMNGMAEAKEVFQKIKQEKYHLLEGMACRGGCINGPGIISPAKLTEVLLKKLSNKKSKGE